MPQPNVTFFPSLVTRVSPRRVMVFKPSAILKQRLNGDSVVSDGKDQHGD
jgi:hypothetical protein